jgi:hypothetical protein
MMSGHAIQVLAREAARKASLTNKTPFMVWPQDIEQWKEDLKEGKLSLPFPFIGDYEPKGYEQTAEFFVDSTGFGGPGEPALTQERFLNVKIKPDHAYAITEIGQFQVYITEYRKVQNAEV